jgi:PAS domain S-box-containing protein
VLVVLLATMPALAGILYMTVQLRRALLADAEQEVLAVVRLLAAEQREVVEGSRQILTSLAQVPEVKQQESGPCSTFLARMRREFPQYANLGVVRPDGLVGCSALPATEPVSLADRAWLRRAIEQRGFVVGDYQVGRLTGRASVNFAYPLMGPGDQVEAVVFAALDLQWLGERLRRWRPSREVRLTLLDPGGTVLFRDPDPERLTGRSVASLAAAREVMAGRVGVTRGLGLDGTDRVLAYAPLLGGPGGLTVMASRPTHHVVAAADRALRVGLVSLVLAALLAAGIAWVGGGLLVTRPLDALVKASRRLASGDFSARSGLKRGGGEMGRLARAFDEMAEALEQLTARSNLVLESAAEGIYGLDRQGRVTFVNSAGAAMFGYLPEEMLGRAMHPLVHRARADGSPYPPETCPILSTLTRGTVRRVTDEVFWRRDGSTFPVEYVSAPMREGDAVTGAVIVFRDVTEARGQEAALRQYAERLEILHEIDRAVMAADSPRAIAEAALGRLRPLLGAARAAVTVVDEAAGEAECLAAEGAGADTLGAGTRFSLAGLRGLTSLRRGEPRVIQEPGQFSTALGARLREAGLASYLILPLVVRGELLGTLNLGFPRTGPFPDWQVQIAREVAGQMALALWQARLHEQVGRHAAELEERVHQRTADLEAAAARLQGEVIERGRAEQEAERANRAKTWFLSRMSHELRTPLNAVLGFAQLLETEPLAADQRESVEHILLAGRHLLALINEVLEISRVETGRLTVSPEPVLVADLLAPAVDLLRPLAAERRVTITLDCPGAEARHVLADRQRTQQVLLNLLSNAIKYNREGGSVRVGWGPAVEGRIRLDVTDTGPGIAPELMGRLFRPFERLGAEATGVEGTGLGLALSKRLVEAMQGSLGAESCPGEGSTFWVELAEAPGPEPGAAPAAEEAAAGSSAAPMAGAERPAGRVLYVEDNLSNLRLLERLLNRRGGHELLTAMQGRLGFDLACQHRPDLILLDLHLPDVDGEEVLGWLRADPRTQAIPVIVMSADATPGRIRRLLQAGARAYLSKPFDVTEALGLIERTLTGEATTS